MTTLILQHTDLTTPGLVTEVLAAAGRAYDLRHLNRGHPLPDAGAHDAVVVLGGGLNVDDDAPFLPAEKAFLRAAVRRGVRLFGLCLGAQLLAEALGARVGPHPRGWEVGWRDVECLAGPGLAGFARAATRRVSHYHRYVFDLPPAAHPVARNDWWECQGFTYRNHVLGLQFHPERTRTQNRELALEAELPPPGPAVQSRREMLAEAAASEAAVRPWFTETLLGWLTPP